MVPWAKLHFISKKVILSFPLSIAAGAQGQPLLWEEVASLLFIAHSPAFRAGCGCSSSFCCEMSLVNSQSLWGWGTRGRQHSTWADFWRAEAAAALGLGLHFKHHQHRNVTDTCMHQKKCLRQGQDGKGFHYPCPLLSARWGPHSRPAESRGSHGFPALHRTNEQKPPGACLMTQSWRIGMYLSSISHSGVPEWLILSENHFNFTWLNGTQFWLLPAVLPVHSRFKKKQDLNYFPQEISKG